MHRIFKYSREWIRVRSAERMSRVISGMAEKQRMMIGLSTLLIFACAVLAPTLVAHRQATSSHITNDPPALPVEQIIQKFAEHEEEFRKERENYTYTQIFLFQTIDDDGQVDGEYRMTSDILFTPAAKRYEKVIEAPASTIQRITMEQQDFDDIEKVWPLVLTPDELPKYDIKYIGREQVDELGTYVFDIAPKKLEKNQRYFQGRIWVEDRDLQIVKTRGKGTGLMKKKQDSAYPLFETFRENIEGRFWFP